MTGAPILVVALAACWLYTAHTWATALRVDASHPEEREAVERRTAFLVLWYATACVVTATVYFASAQP